MQEETRRWEKNRYERGEGEEVMREAKATATVPCGR